MILGRFDTSLPYNAGTGLNPWGRGFEFGITLNLQIDTVPSIIQPTFVKYINLVPTSKRGFENSFLRIEPIGILGFRPFWS